MSYFHLAHFINLKKFPPLSKAAVKYTVSQRELYLQNSPHYNTTNCIRVVALRETAAYFTAALDKGGETSLICKAGHVKITHLSSPLLRSFVSG